MNAHRRRHHSVPNENENEKSRRNLLSLVAGTTATAAVLLSPIVASARYMLDEGTGDYVEVEDVDWQTAWKERLDKASTMSREEIFEAARGAGNVDLKEGEESNASKKRRALSACRSPEVRSKASAGNEKECTQRVLGGGDFQFLLDVL